MLTPEDLEQILDFLEARERPAIETRTVGIRFRVTPEARAQYARAAKDCGLTLSEWLRMRCERL